MNFDQKNKAVDSAFAAINTTDSQGVVQPVVSCVKSLVLEEYIKVVTNKS